MPIDRARYPDDWEEISKRIRFERAGGRCECRGECGGHAGWCEARHGEAHPVTGSTVYLTTAHLDGVPEHSEDDNLRAMCPRCHTRYDRPQHWEVRRLKRAAQAAQAEGRLF